MGIWIEEWFRSLKPRLAANIPLDMVMNMIEEHDSIALSQKIDGKRLMLVRDDDRVFGVGRDGQETNVPTIITDTFSRVKPRWIFDGELLGNVYHVFDVISFPGGSITSWSWKDRQELLDTVLTGQFDCAKVVTQVYGYNRIPFFETLKESKAEGVMLANVLSPYYMGTRSSNIGKYKFIKQADCVVMDQGIDGRQNLVLGLYDNGTLVEVGKVSALTGDGGKAKIGDVVQVNFLYATADHRLFQPTLPKLRLDKPPSECNMTQLTEHITNKTVLSPDERN